MKRLKEELLENDFGAYLYDLRQKKGYSIEELAEMFNNENITVKKIRKWEHDLEFPNIDEIYKLSEIYEVPSEEFLQVKTQTLQEGTKMIHKNIIRIIGYILGLSMYGSVVFSYIFLWVAGIGSILFFAAAIGGLA